MHDSRYYPLILTLPIDARDTDRVRRIELALVAVERMASAHVAAVALANAYRDADHCPIDCGTTDAALDAAIRNASVVLPGGERAGELLALAERVGGTE